MNKQPEESKFKLPERSSHAATKTALSELITVRKHFIEPQVSDAIKVLKATQFFQQFSDNGNTGRPSI